MKIDRARAIVSHMLEHWSYGEKLRTEKPDPLAYSLAEMLEANDKVRLQNEKGKQLRYGQTLLMFFDERLVAAMFVAMEWEGKPETVVYANGNHTVVLSDAQLNEKINC